MNSTHQNCAEASWDFGFLRYPHSIQFEGGSVEVGEQYAAACEEIDKYRHRDGNLYPPIQRTVPIDWQTGEHGDPLENTERPARVFPPPLSHEIFISSRIDDGDIRRGDAALIVHLLALLFDTRLQFDGWRFDGKVPIPDKSSILLLRGALEDSLSAIYQNWRLWSESHRNFFVKILYMHARAKSCEWSWYRFLTEYMVLDAIHRFSVQRGILKNEVKHRDRIIQMCEQFEVPQDARTIESIVSVRNELIHEASIEGALPGTRTDDTFHLSKWLGRLNSRLIFAVSGYPNEFVRSGWWFFGWQRFNKADRNCR
ncbi:hypothetical protein [Wenzhouxiangella sediminis]|uniref:Apea-like HEPN domain-containing protein n=1 Tax=Wenzhouxiangella sediminis TaxID=1792836 RepID=A0A3E1K6P5_9GAMM|nr:hypothetical protein [Wenzhouxiangella sediminis]RFF29700.1 hypothetical protein DZC52_11485 [Wenzhouxiangella sediminis]